MEKVIQLYNVSKVFNLVQRDFISFFRNKKNSKANYICSIKDISIDIFEGESVGVMGRNGSGKSTFLKLVSGVLRPTCGKITTKGSIFSILELTAGLDLNLTGKENIYNLISLYQVSKPNRSKIINEIIEFSELKNFINIAVNKYSSGMVVRLAFSIAISTQPQILLIDEALAVGDQKFKNKCIRKIKSLKQKGTTLIFVSHSPGLIKSLCDRVIVLESGEKYFDGNIHEGVTVYSSFLNKLEIKQKRISNINKLENELITLKSCHIKNCDGRIINVINEKQDFMLEINAVSTENLNDIHFGFTILDQFSNIIFGTTTYALKSKIKKIKPKENLTIFFKIKNILRSGKYTVSIGCVKGAHGFPQLRWEKHIFLIHDIISFEVKENNTIGRWEGPVMVDTTVNYLITEINA